MSRASLSPKTCGCRRISLSPISRATSLDREAAFLTRDLRVDHHLQEQVAEFFAQIRVVACPDRVRDFVGFLKQSRDERWRAFARDPRGNRPARAVARRFRRVAERSMCRRGGWRSIERVHDSPSTVAINHQQLQIRQSERWLPNSETSPEVFLPT